VRAILAEVLVQQRQYEAAENLLRSGLALHPESGFLNAGLATIYGLRGKHEEAGELAKKTLATHPGFIYAIAPLGYAHLHLKQHDLALTTANYLIDWNPKIATGYDLASKASAQRGDFGKAEEYANKAIECEPKNPATHLNKGEVLFAKRDFKRGYPSLESAAKLMAGPIPFLTGPARELANNKLPFEAAWLFTEIVKRDPTDKIAVDGMIGALQVTREAAAAKKQLGPSFEMLTTEQTKRFDAIPAPERAPVATTANVSRPLNAQQTPIAPTSPKRNRY
jgi:tetratricopeptide (TPR) repeat protein